jgi:hypothetical protein
MQTAVKLMMEMHNIGVGEKGQGEGETSPKHLRVGVNSALVESGALVGMLIRKGILTGDEWEAALADMMEREVENYRKQMSLPDSVQLG